MSRLLMFIATAAMLTSLAQVSLKKASQYNLFQYGISFQTIMSFSSNIYIWLGLFLYFASFVLSVKIFELENLSLITPLFMGLVFLFVTLLSIMFFHDSISLKKLLGQIVILVGIYVLAS
jgi:multidrug transporter EmrE-like cation transporter